MITSSKGNTKRLVLTVLATLSFLYLGQGFIYWARLNQIDAKPLFLESAGETCDELNCTAAWTFTADARFLLIGHLLRTHTVTDLQSGRTLVPTSTVRGTSVDSWARLRVYELQPGKRYDLRATKYKSIKMGYFIGILPRTTNHEGVLGIPDIGPTISMISGLVLAFITCIMFASAYIGGASNVSGRGKSRQALHMFAVASVFAALSAFISLGILDSLLPEGDMRNKLLRISVLQALILPLASQIPWMRSGNVFAKALLCIAAVVLGTLLGWPWIRGGATWAQIICALTVAGSVILARKRHFVAAGIWSLAMLDSAKIMGLFHFIDMPPTYFNNVTSFSALTIVAGQLGGFATISMAGLAYRRFRRDIVLTNIQETIATVAKHDSIASIAQLQTILPDVASITGAGRVTIIISLPLGRPITQTYDVASKEIKVFDDGKIPGAVTLRSLVYGDEAMFESFEEFSERVRVPGNPGLNASEFFSAVPLRVNQTIVGTMMLTRFDDNLIRRLKGADPVMFMQEDRETIHLVAERLSQSLSKLIVRDLNAMATLSRALQTSIHQAIAASDSADDFLVRFARSVQAVSGLSVMIHEHRGDKGVAVAEAGIAQGHWKVFVEHPFNLAADAAPAYGPTVVAFRDKKSSYVKDILELSDRMHPRTIEIMNKMMAMSVVAVPLHTLHRSFVITLISSRGSGAADPAIVSVLEATEALFVAAVEVMSQKTSVLALGQLASRLIGDDEVRGKILDAAKTNDLPTTIGSPRISFLLLFDLAGSSDLSEDTETKARAYGQFYDAVNRKCQEVLGGMIRKTIGDAVIVTWDGTNVTISENNTLLSDLRDVVHYADHVAKAIGCKGSRAILHYGRYFLGLVGTQTFGQIDVIGSGIDEVCKMEGNMKILRLRGHPLMLAVSATAAEHLPAIFSGLSIGDGFEALPDGRLGKTAIQYGYVDVSKSIDSKGAA